MVNTFLTNTDYSISAANLDSRRLNKQVTEAIQILNNIDKIFVLSNHYQISISFPLKSWITTLMQTYRLDPKEIIWDGNGKKLTTGFMNHPAVRMWLFSRESLHNYIVFHLIECRNRRINRKEYVEWISPIESENLRDLIDLIVDETKPTWTRNEEVMKKHRCRLLMKEFCRGEARHYQNKKSWVLEFQIMINEQLNQSYSGDALEHLIYLRDTRPPWTISKLNPNLRKTLEEFIEYIWPEDNMIR